MQCILQSLYKIHDQWNECIQSQQKPVQYQDTKSVHYLEFSLLTLNMWLANLNYLSKCCFILLQAKYCPLSILWHFNTSENVPSPFFPNMRYSKGNTFEINEFYSSAITINRFVRLWSIFICHMDISNNSSIFLTHFLTLTSFCTPWKHKKPEIFWCFQGV